MHSDGGTEMVGSGAPVSDWYLFLSMHRFGDLPAAAEAIMAVGDH